MFYLFHNSLFCFILFIIYKCAFFLFKQFYKLVDFISFSLQRSSSANNITYVLQWPFLQFECGFVLKRDFLCNKDTREV